MTLTQPTNEAGSSLHGEHREAHGASASKPRTVPSRGTRDLTAIPRIVRDRHTTGSYGSAHFRLNPTLADDMRSQTPPPSLREPAWLGNPIGDLLSIPVRVDNTLPPDTWRLVDTLTGALLFEGTAPVRGATDSLAAT